MSLHSLITIDLSIGDKLTKISCGHIVVELIKFIAYQRLQIPYTYQWLKQIVNNRKNLENRKESFQSERHFRIASTALDNLDFIIKSLQQEINGSCIPNEVCIAFGGSAISCKEVYRLLLPTICHKSQCHSGNIASDQKIQHNVFRTLVTSDALSDLFYSELPPTNMHVFIKKNVQIDEVSNTCGESFVPASGCKMPRNAKVVVIDFRSCNYESVSCCNDIKIFGDDQTNIPIYEQIDKIDFSEIESSDSAKWFQSTYVMKGFKDSTINGSSVTNTWLER